MQTRKITTEFSVSSFLKFAALWLGSITWHLWRIATLRPAFKNLADSKFTVFSFLAVYVFIGFSRWIYLSNYLIADIGLNLLIQVVLVTLIFNRKYRSNSLLTVLFGASAIVNLLAFPVITLFSGNWLLLIETLLYVNCIWRFYQEPVLVRTAGYSLLKLA